MKSKRYEEGICFVSSLLSMSYVREDIEKMSREEMINIYKTLYPRFDIYPDFDFNYNIKDIKI